MRFLRDQFEWSVVTHEAEFSPRDTGAAFRLAGDLWIANGYAHGGILTSDVWRSADGASWQLVTEEAPYQKSSPVVALNDRIYAVWRTAWASADGKEWEHLADVPFHSSSAPMLGTFRDKLVVVSLDEVWESSDGKSWTQLAANAPMGPRYGGQLLEFRGRLYLIAGATQLDGDSGEQAYPDYLTHSDVWVSDAGSEWELLTDNPGWEPRLWHSVVPYAGKLWLFGGFSNRRNINLGDLWWSDDGRTWHQAELTGGPSPRHFASAIATDEGLLIAAGNSWPVLNDVWLLRIPENQLVQWVSLQSHRALAGLRQARDAFYRVLPGG